MAASEQRGVGADAVAGHLGVTFTELDADGVPAELAGYE
jgi:hypothetical protein